MYRGISYPLEFTRNGDLKEAEDLDLTVAHIKHILETLPGERIMRQDFGLPPQVFRSFLPFIVANTIKRSINREIVSEIKVKVNKRTEEGGLILDVFYGKNSLPLQFELRE